MKKRGNNRSRARKRRSGDDGEPEKDAKSAKRRIAGSSDEDAGTSSKFGGFETLNGDNFEENTSNSTLPKDRSDTDEYESTATVDLLPNKILVQIFEMLNLATRIRVERVCRRWNLIARQYAWSRTQKIDYLLVADEFISGTAGGDLAGDEDDYDSGEEFMLSRRGINLDMCHYMFSRPRLTNDSLRQLLDRSGRYLVSLDLSGYRDVIDYRVLRDIGQQCPNLESINLTGILVTNSSLLSLARGCWRLKSISLQRCFNDSVVDRGLSSLFESCQELISLNLSENEHVNGMCFEHLPRTIRHLDVSACYAFSDEALKVVADRCESLEGLYLDCCDRLSTASLAYAFNRLTQLRVLRLNELYVFGDYPIPSAVAAMQTLGKLSNLRALYMNNNYLIDDTVIHSVARSCPLLETLDVSGTNKALTDNMLVSLAGYGCCRTLKRLNLSYLSQITDDGIKHLVRCTKLQTLILHRCKGIGDEGLTELAKYCHEMRQLDVSCCYTVTNASVLAFGKERSRYNRARQTKKQANESESNGGQLVGLEEMRKKKYTPPPGGITIFVDATRIQRAKVRKNKFIKLMCRGTSGLWPLWVD